MIEEDEQQGSSSDSSTCVVGTTTQGLEAAAPQKGKHGSKRAALSVIFSKERIGLIVCFCGYSAFIIQQRGSLLTCTNVH